MPCREPIFYQDGFYHVYNRGNNRSEIFFEDDDYVSFEFRLEKFLKHYEINLHAYILMPNHFHLLLEQTSEVSISKFMQSLGSSYTQYLNKSHSKKGSLFESRFKAKHIDNDEYLLQLTKYIHRNALVAGLVSNLGEYRWSSYSSYVSLLSKPFVVTHRILEYFSRKDSNDFREFCQQEFSELDVYRISDQMIDLEEEL